MSNTATAAVEPVKIGIQFYCSEEEAMTIKNAAEKTMRSTASFARFHSLKAAQAVSEGKSVE